MAAAQYSGREAVDRKRPLDTLQERSPSRSYTRQLDALSPDRKVSRFEDEYSRPSSRYADRPEPSWQSQDTMRRAGNGRDGLESARDVGVYAAQDERSVVVWDQKSFYIIRCS